MEGGFPLLGAMRTCRFCGRTIERKTNARGRQEAESHALRRTYCDRACAVADHNKAPRLPARIVHRNVRILFLVDEEGNEFTCGPTLLRAWLRAGKARMVDDRIEAT